MSRQPLSERMIVASARERLPDIFVALDRCVDGVVEALQRIERPAPGPGQVAVQMVDRGFNTLKGAKLLLEHDHWELAATHVRLLFELNLDAEGVMSAEDRNDSALRYTKFALLQEIRYQAVNLRYDIGSGRGNEETAERLGALEEKAYVWFQDIMKPRTKEGLPGWPDNWTGKSIKKRAATSAHALRKHQYNTVFFFLSAYTHAAPMAVSGADAHLGGDIEARVAADDLHIVEVSALLVAFFAELWTYCSDYLPNISSAITSARTTIASYMHATNQAAGGQRGRR